ncbi:class I SAM-dependent methyltransferase [Bacillus shivajii]|uniref:class I SAM-dependent methyltransferase n=1 Tax=Bacillus shivajii TaxID=1983719 RepID=UPI001CFBEAAF|nr:class I SAM-dependent methyltransferase [Bacillus shivajii]UCZ53626.1 class I SAM-dependent methyltransferase [Bacillus shivajii]
MERSAKELVKETFSKNAQKYFDSRTHADESNLQLLLDSVTPKAHWKALDVATGGGHVAKHLAPHVQQVLATDLTKQMLENTAKHLQQLKNIDYVIADAESMPFLDEQFDLVTCRIAAHHFPNLNLFVKEVYRILKPDGLFCLIDNVAPENDHLKVFMNTFEKMRDPSHVKALPTSEWKHLLQNSSFKHLEEYSRKKELNYKEWMKRTVEKDEIAHDVNAFFLNANRTTKDYFHIQEYDEHIVSFSIDEWMIICQK